jgi:circadian clock protein KaiC
MTQATSAYALLSTGVEGLDNVLGGGLTAQRLYLVEGRPGTGKTTVGMQFLLAGRDRGEPVLYITLSETREEIVEVTRGHGWHLEGVEVQELLPHESELDPDQRATLFHASEIELADATQRILDEVRRVRPSRIVLDSLSELKLLAGSSLRYRRQVLALKQYFAGQRCTVMLLDDMTAGDGDQQVHSIAHAVLRLEQMHSDYGATRRRLVVSKYRGRAYRDGFHDYRIARGGLCVYPRLIAAEHVPVVAPQRFLSGLAALDALLGGGLDRGTSTLLVGAPGTGKSSLAAQYVLSATESGERAAVFLFDESVATWRFRSESMGMKVGRQIDAGRLLLRQVDPAELSPGEFIDHLREAVQRDAAKVVVIDSLTGYLNAMPDEHFLIVQLHEVLTFLNQAGVSTFLIGAQHGLIGTNMTTAVDASYLSDAVVLLRYFEADGLVQQAISVIKKRTGPHERSIRSFALTDQGLVIGEPLRQYRGVLTGVPQREAPLPNERL